MADQFDDTNFFWQSKYGRSERNQGIVDGSDALANGGQFVISFHHIPSGKEVFFKAYISQYQENFNNDWKSEVVFGRTDPIYTYSNTRRTISLGFDVPASSQQEAYENMGRLQKLAQMQYAGYASEVVPVDGGYSWDYTIAQSPLVRIKVMNLVQRDTLGAESLGQPAAGSELSRSRLYAQYGAKGNSDAGNGILAAINNVSFNTDFQNHAIFEQGPNVVLPQNFEVSVDFNVIHERTNGWDFFGDAINPGMPYGVQLKTPTTKEKVNSRATYEKRLQLERNRQAAEDIAAARFRGALGGRRAQNAIDRYERRKAKGKADSYDEALASEAQTYLDSE